MLRGQVEAEMGAARLARAQGNEGRARVCARRAAGHAIRAYREAIGGKDRAHSAYGLLRWIASLPEIEEPLRACAERLAARVTPEHVLPHPQDPLGDATLLIEGLIEKALPTQISQEAEPGDSRHLTP
ncbi:MAG TPA: hypothetical protein VJK02_18080 [Anaerolineales bacterium]|nr:hypothetical protein [Anaerolineales bacterium]